MREVVPVRTDVEVTVQSGESDEARLRAIAEERHLGGPIRRLSEALAKSASPAD